MRVKKRDVEEKYMPRVLKNRVLRKIHGRQGEEVAGDKQKLSSGFLLLARR